MRVPAASKYRRPSGRATAITASPPRKVVRAEQRMEMLPVGLQQRNRLHAQMPDGEHCGGNAAAVQHDIFRAHADHAGGRGPTARGFCY